LEEFVKYRADSPADWAPMLGPQSP